MNFKQSVILLFFCFCIPFSIVAKTKLKSNIIYDDRDLPDSAKPWVFWYWMHASFSQEGITADLEAMKEAGIAGAYLAPIKGKTEPALFEPVIETLSPEWWKIAKYAFKEAERLGIQIALLPNDGFATAGGPWITPELSMQKVVWTEENVVGGTTVDRLLETPESYESYYKDIAVFAIPTDNNYGQSSFTQKPKVTTSNGVNADFLAIKDNKQNFGSNQPCWIQYEFEKPFTCSTIKIDVNNYNHQSHRLIIEVSDDGVDFRKVTRLTPPRTGWLDWDFDVTHSIEPVTAKYFRFVYDPEGTEPGAEDLDAAKWKQSLKIAGISLFTAPKIHQFEGKSGKVWRVAARTTKEQIANEDCVPLEKVVDISRFMDTNGRLQWQAPQGKWTILRMGHTSTGHKNETAGAGKGLECDKFNPEAVKLQFDGWFMKAREVAGPELAAKVLSVFHVDSWECGSQNWSPVFSKEFVKRRGYDPIKYLPVLAGIPLESADLSERFLYDVRQTISEVMADNFFTVLADLTHENGAIFTSETTAPVMAADGLVHFREVDVPMGEFWLRSPSHDKPNDILDAISASRIYGKPIVQAEAFTQIRMEWDEHPGNLKTLQDRNYALGINNLVYHVFTHNPWMDRKPGMTLDGVGLYFQRDQTWWKPGKAWVDYARRSHSLLQQGVPIVDIAVFIGEELPRRAILPDRLINTLPGIFGKEKVEENKERMLNVGSPTQRIVGVTTGANMAQPENWVNPLRGYAYDSFNPDVLLNRASVKNGRIVLPGGASYGVLVLPGAHPLQPDAELMTPQVAQKLLQLINEGATVVLGERPTKSPSLENYPQSDAIVKKVAEELWDGKFESILENEEVIFIKKIGKGNVIKGPYHASTFSSIGIEKDLITTEVSGQYAADIAWTHRATDDADIYFVANQREKERLITLSFRVSDKVPVLYDAVTGRSRAVQNWQNNQGRTSFNLKLHKQESVFVVFESLKYSTQPIAGNAQNSINTSVKQIIASPWKVQFDSDFKGPEKEVIFKELNDWSLNTDSSIRYYSGTADYKTTFKWKQKKNGKRVWLDVGDVANIAEVTVNGINCGVIWTAPYRIDITDALKKGKNKLNIAVTNTWANRMVGDHNLPESERLIKTTAPYRLEGNLLKAGLLGPVTILMESTDVD